MSKKKNKTQNKQAPLSPEKFMRTRMRSLPIDECYLSKGLDSGIAQVLVSRKHNQGTHSFALFLVDIWCRGVVDSFYVVNIDDDEYQKRIEQFKNDLEAKPIDYDYAHNLIYGALDWADGAGIEPGKEFAISQYMLEEDNDDSPYMELEFGRNGKYCLCVAPEVSPGKYLQALDKNIGKGNYDYILDKGEDEEYADTFYNKGVSGEYSYQHPDYPELSELDKLYYLDLPHLLEKDISLWDEEVLDEVLMRDHDKLAQDLNLIIRTTIGATWPLIEENEELEERYTNIPHGCMMLLGEVGTEKDADAVFELLRQSDDYLYYFLGDDLSDSTGPVLYKLCKNNYELIDKFMREPGLDWYAKVNTLVPFVHQCYKNDPQKRDDLIALSSGIATFLLENQDNTLIWDGSVAAFLIEAFEVLKATECDTLVKELYATGKVDEEVYGNVNDAIDAIRNRHPNSRTFPLPLKEWVKEFKNKWYPDN